MVFHLAHSKNPVLFFFSFLLDSLLLISPVLSARTWVVLSKYLMDEWDWAEQWNLEYRRLIYIGASLVAQLVKSLPALQETWVRSLGWENPLENGMAILSSILAWRIPWSIPCGHKESDSAEWRSLSLYIYMYIYMDREAWRAVIHGVAKSGTRLSDWTELNWYIYTHT